MPVPPAPSNENKSVKEYLYDYLNSSKFINIINKVYDNNIYYRVNNTKNSCIQNSLFAIAKILENLSFNDRIFKNLIYKGI